jgi:GT2 family glycosyltransferase
MPTGGVCLKIESCNSVHLFSEYKNEYIFMLKVAVIIPFFGGSAYLPKLIESIFSGSDDLDTIVYIVDNSIAGEEAKGDVLRHEKVVVLKAEPGIGYGKACNIAYRKCVESNIDIIVVANQDGFFAHGSLKKLVDSLRFQVEFAVAVPLLTEYHSNQVEGFFTHVYLSPMTELVSDLFAGTVKQAYPIRDLCGACFALKMEEYQSIPYLFDELYKMYYEDGDLYHRLSNLNKSVMFVPAAIFHHSHSNTKDHLQTVASLTVKRTSKHIFSIKNSEKSFGKALLAWMLLEFRTVIENLLKLNFRQLSIEIVSSFRLVGKIGAIRRSRENESKFMRL